MILKPPEEESEPNKNLWFGIGIGVMAIITIGIIFLELTFQGLRLSNR